MGLSEGDFELMPEQMVLSPGFIRKPGRPVRYICVFAALRNKYYLPWRLGTVRDVSSSLSSVNFLAGRADTLVAPRLEEDLNFLISLWSSVCRCH